MATQKSDTQIRDIPDNSFIVLSAARKAGKTHLASHICRLLGNRFVSAFVISTTSKLQNSFAFIPRDCHHNPDMDGDFDEFVGSILDYQMSRKEEGLELGQILLICDDLFTNSQFGAGRTSKVLSRIAATGRHLKIFTLLITQRWASLSPSIRSQATDWICFRPRSCGERTMLTDQFLSRGAGNRKECRMRAEALMSSIFDGPDSAYKAMWINCDARSSHLDDIVSWARAPAAMSKWKMRLKSLSDHIVKEASSRTTIESEHIYNGFTICE